jgi:hypothetical protein
MATFTLVSHAGVDTLHVEHPWEVCNVDDADQVEKVDDLTAAALLEEGKARPCQHCRPLDEDAPTPLEEPPTLNTRGDAP